MSKFYKLNKKSKTHCNGDGYITKDGHTMFQQDIVDDLNHSRASVKYSGKCYDELHDKADELRADKSDLQIQLKTKESEIERLKGLIELTEADLDKKRSERNKYHRECEQWRNE